VLKISVVIPTRNRCDSLKRAIKSVLNQTFRDFEIIVVNDGSTDNTSEYLSSLKEPLLHSIELSTNSGGGSARNEGIENARGSFTAFLDDDDEWEPSKLQEQMNAIDRHNVDIVHTGINCYRSNGSFLKYVFMTPAFKDTFKSMMNDNYLGGTSSILVKISSLKKSGFFDPELPALQDWDLYIRLLKSGCSIHGINKPLVKYHIVDPTKNVSINYTRYKNASDYLKKKYRDYPFYPIFARRIKIIEFKRCLKSRHFLLDALQYYFNSGKIQ
jgi:glycosyltransferase involved in cell wall biosynthesis